jgi:type IV secretory pathway VirD2 relaxase
MMASLFAKLRQRRTLDTTSTEKQRTLSHSYEQYKTSNISSIYKVLYPPLSPTKERNDGFVSKRMEVAKTIPNREQEKKFFTAVNENAAEQSQQAGVKVYDWAY